VMVSTLEDELRTETTDFLLVDITQALHAAILNFSGHGCRQESGQQST